MAWYTAASSGATCVRAYAPVGAASLAASYVDETGNQDAAPGVAPTWAYGTGWTFNGTTQYLGFGHALDGTTAQSVIVRMTMRGSGTRGIMWEGQSGTADLFAIESNREFIRVDTASTSLTYSMSNTASVFAFVNSASGWVVYVNGSSVASGTGRTGTFDSVIQQFEIGRAELTGGATRYVEADVAAIAIYSGALDLTDLATITAAANALPVTGAPASIVAQMHHHHAVFGG